ncbi:MAG: hypothetical protein ACOYEV_06480 [Candidatus Nanopelagicales bacterium]
MWAQLERVDADQLPWPYRLEEDGLEEAASGDIVAPALRPTVRHIAAG